MSITSSGLLISMKETTFLLLYCRQEVLVPEQAERAENAYDYVAPVERHQRHPRIIEHEDDEVDEMSDDGSS